MADFGMQWANGSLDGERILTLSGPFTLSAVTDFQDAIRNAPPPMLILNLSAVSYMDSAALGSLMGLHVSCQKDGRKYALVEVAERLKALLRVAGVTGILTIYGTLAEAERGLRETPASA